MLLGIALVAAASAVLFPVPQALGVSVYPCPPSGHRRILTNYGGYKFQINLAPVNSSYLHANMDCPIQVIGYSSSRWLVTIEYSNLNAYQAEFSIRESSSSGKEVITVTKAGTVYRQIGVNAGSFHVRLITKSGPSGMASGAKLTIEHLGSGQCPSDWYTVPGSSGYCYGVPKHVEKLTYEKATKGCQMMLANLVMGNFDYDSISTELKSASSSVISSKEAYWVGLYSKDGDLKFLNKYNSMDAIYGRLCSYSSSTCQCVAYQGGRFYRDECDSAHKYVCYMPKGGSSSYYDIDGLVATTSSVITVLAIILTVGFIAAVLISLVVVLICCCIRQKSARECRARRNGGVVAGPASTGIAAGAAYPQQAPAPPPYTIATASAPPYVPAEAAIYDNAAFAAGSAAPAYGDTAGGGGAPAGGAEKPPPYNTEGWSGQQVPA